MSQQVFRENKSELDYLKINNNSKTAFILLHGYGASMYDLYGIGSYMKSEISCDWIFPNGHLGLMGGMLMSRAWFPIDAEALEKAMQTGQFRDFESVNSPEFQDAVDKSKTFVESIAEEYDYIILGGFSQGAMISTHVSLELDEKLSALVCLSGTLISKESLINKLDHKNKFPFFQSHGKQDPILDYSSAKNLFELLKLGGHQGEFIGFDGAHEIPESVLMKMNKFLKTYTS